MDEVSLGGVRHFVGLMKETSSDFQEHRTLLQDTRGVVNSLSVPAVVINPQGRIEAFNAMAEQLLGYTMVRKNNDVLIVIWGLTCLFLRSMFSERT